MSFLDRLKREADQQRQQAEQAALEREQRDTQYRTQVEPKIKALTGYLEGLATTLREVKPPIVIRMAIQGYGELCLVPFWDYKVEHERRHRSFQVTMTWSLKVDGERTPVVRADGVTRVRTLTSIFRQYHLGGIKEEKRTPQGELSCATFHARGYIKARMEASISAEDPILRLMFENASWLGASRRQVPLEQVDDDLFDRIARFVVREDDSLFTEELPDALRQKLGKDPLQSGTATAPVAAPASPAMTARDSAPREPAPAAAAPGSTTQPAASSGPKRDEAAAPTVPPVAMDLVFQIDESKLGLADFEDTEPSSNPFAAGAVQRAAPAPRLDSRPKLTDAIGVIPAPPPVTGGEVIEIDESKLGLSGEAAPIVIERTPAQVPAPATRVQALPVPASPNVVRDSAIAPPTTRMAPAAAPPKIPVAAPEPPAAAAAPVNAAPSTASTTPIAADSGSAIAPGDEPTDESKERDAALFRLRMRAMLARLRTDEASDNKG